METLGKGKHLSLVSRNGWEFVKRNNVTGVVEIIAMTEDAELLLVEQWREPVQARVLELPAGLVGDVNKDEAFEEAAQRELIEETGYKAQKIHRLLDSPALAGASAEILTFVLANGLEKVSEGGGDDSENIEVHKVSPFDFDKFADEKKLEGVLIDSRIYAGLGLLLDFFKRTSIE